MKTIDLKFICEFYHIQFDQITGKKILEICMYFYQYKIQVLKSLRPVPTSPTTAATPTTPTYPTTPTTPTTDHPDHPDHPDCAEICLSCPDSTINLSFKK
jgi:hypothetical protein